VNESLDVGFHSLDLAASGVWKGDGRMVKLRNTALCKIYIKAHW